MAYNSFFDLPVEVLESLDDEEIETLILLDMENKRKPTFNSGEHYKYERMTFHNFNKLSNEECYSRFRYILCTVGSYASLSVRLPRLDQKSD